MKPQFPHRYTSTITRVAHGLATIEAPPRPPLTGGPPPELHGDPATWSPEHLLISALGLCLFATFDVFAARDGIAVLEWRDTVTGVLDRTATGLAFQTFTISVEVTVDAADVERTRAVLERASRYCIVSKALRVPVTIEPHIWSHEERSHAPAANLPGGAPATSSVA
jgi:organic hydroperoxide reductase OsmC/OhrA